MSAPDLVLATVSRKRLALGVGAWLLAAAAMTWLFFNVSENLSEHHRREILIGYTMMATFIAAECVQAFKLVAACVLNKGNALYIRSGKLIEWANLRKAASLSDITGFSRGPELVFEGVPVWINLHTNCGGKRSIKLAFLDPSVHQIMSRLQAAGIPQRTDDERPRPS